MWWLSRDTKRQPPISGFPYFETHPPRATQFKIRSSGGGLARTPPEVSRLGWRTWNLSESGRGEGAQLRYVLLKNQQDATAPFILHFHGSGVVLRHSWLLQVKANKLGGGMIRGWESGETAADYRRPQLAEKYRVRMRSSIA